MIEFVGSLVALLIIFGFGTYVQYKTVLPGRKLKDQVVKQSAEVVDKMKQKAASGDFPRVESKTPQSGTIG